MSGTTAIVLLACAAALLMGGCARAEGGGGGRAAGRLAELEDTVLALQLEVRDVQAAMFALADYVAQVSSRLDVPMVALGGGGGRLVAKRVPFYGSRGKRINFYGSRG